MTAAVSFHDVVLSIHIMAVVVAFGGMFAYPILVAVGRRLDPRALPVLHRAQQQIIRRVLTPGLVVVIAAGIYLASDLDAFSKAYVAVGFVAAVVLGGLAGGYFAPRERQLAQLAERDLAGGGALGSEYDALSHQVGSVSGLAGIVVLATIFVMAVHLGA
jgi:uncharacterized membrane protein